MDILKIYASKQICSDFVDLHILSGDKNNRSIVTNIEFGPLEMGAYTSPSMSLAYEEGQFLMDSLWSCGLRPSEGSGSAGAMAAAQNHLADMRAIVSKQLKVDLK